MVFVTRLTEVGKYEILKTEGKAEGERKIP